ncbi:MULTISPECIES: hypothetical protein [Catenuloplanes]|uniref:Uncharacterized protein n=1 Tax=Catenuloplanes niger TaxID=587534 RepID=A0AAE3ZPQ6_9ACTN|nr:hypothetical protein [Catenuloplanes niger]MDR7322674.1 hypothetical protein [Catenuloplanes niger]
MRINNTILNIRDCGLCSLHALSNHSLGNLETLTDLDQLIKQSLASLHIFESANEPRVPIRGLTQQVGQLIEVILTVPHKPSHP